MQGCIAIMDFIPIIKRNIPICFEQNNFLSPGCMVIIYVFTSHRCLFLKSIPQYVDICHPTGRK